MVDSVDDFDRQAAGMRVLQVISKAEHGGAQTQVAMLTQGLRSAGHEVLVVSSKSGPLLLRCAEVGAEVATIGGLASSRPWHMLAAVRGLRDEILRWSPDVVHCHSTHAGLSARIASATRRVACVFTAHGLPFKSGVPLARRTLVWFAEFIAARLPATMICVNEFEAALARRWLWMPPARLRVIPTAILGRSPDGPSDRAAPVYEGLGDESVVDVVTVARLAPPKRVDLLIDAVALSTLPWRLHVVGGGPDLDVLRRRASEAGDSVRFWGDRSDVAEILRRSDVFVLSSDHEGAPVSVLEAMRAGLPVVASDLPGLRAQLGDAGALVPNTAQAFAQAIELLAASPETRRRSGDAGRERFAKRFTVDRLTTSTIAVYEECRADT